MSGMAAALPVVGGVVTAAGQYQEGEEKLATSRAQGAQMRRNAGQLRAAGQAQGAEELRKAELMRSRILAVAAASGGGVTDPTVVNLVSANAAEGSLAAATHRYNAESKAQDTEYQAMITEKEGEAYARASKYKALGRLFGAGGQLFGRAIPKSPASPRSETGGD